MELEWESYEELLDEWRAWRKPGGNQADFDCLIWWFKVIVRLMFVLIRKTA